MRRGVGLGIALIACLTVVTICNLWRPEIADHFVSRSTVIADESAPVLSSRFEESDAKAQDSKSIAYSFPFTVENSNATRMGQGNSTQNEVNKTASYPQFVEVGCLKHAARTVNATLVRGQAIVRLEMTMRDGCGPLRRDWRSNPPLSPLARAILQHQSNCSLPVVTWDMDNMFGIGSHLSQWSQAMCYAWERGLRLRSYNPIWLWMDQTYCNMTDAAERSPWLCYLPDVEFLCDEKTALGNLTMSNPLFQRNQSWHNSLAGFMPAFRAASLEYMFRTVSTLVIQEAQRQIGVLFGPQGAPSDLITVHVRWGDKFHEMKLLDIQEYVKATSSILLNKLGRHENSTAHIYLATEDPVAASAFMRAAPTSWKIYQDVAIAELDHFRPSNGNPASFMSKNTLGRGGLLDMASLLVGLEANYFVLTTASSFSRIINGLRTSIIDPRCDNCTFMIDLRPGMWR